MIKADHWIYFELETNQKFDRFEAETQQLLLGFNSTNYGFYDFYYNKRRKRYSWRCSSTRL